MDTMVCVAGSTRNMLSIICSWITASVFLPVQEDLNTRNLLLMQTCIFNYAL